MLRANPRGSTKYGPAFAAANKNDFGGDYRDIMAGLDYVLKTEPVDPSRLALEGYRYGGEMAGFVEGKTSRFKAIISGAPVIDQYSEYMAPKAVLSMIAGILANRRNIRRTPGVKVLSPESLMPPRRSCFFRATPTVQTR